MRLQRGWSAQFSLLLEPSGTVHIITLVVNSVPIETDMLGLSGLASGSSLSSCNILWPVVGALF